MNSCLLLFIPVLVVGEMGVNLKPIATHGATIRDGAFAQTLIRHGLMCLTT